jgi:hypothetical protein
MKDMAQVAFQAYYGQDADFRGETDQSKCLWKRVAFMVIATAEKFHADGSERKPSQLDRIEDVQNQILEEVMKTQTDLDAGIATLTADDVAVLAAVQTSGTAIDTSLADLLAKIAANPTAPVSDFTAEVTALAQTHTDFTAAIASLQAVSATATADDPGAPAAETPAPAATADVEAAKTTAS